MATLTLQTPIKVGDLVNGITVDTLDLVSLAINFQGPSAVVSIMLRHSASGWIHTITLTGADGDAQWAAIRAAFPNLEKQFLTTLVKKLPAGVLS
jgi:hypothetical protein